MKPPSLLPEKKPCNDDELEAEDLFLSTIGPNCDFTFSSTKILTISWSASWNEWVMPEMSVVSIEGLGLEYSLGGVCGGLWVVEWVAWWCGHGVSGLVPMSETETLWK